MIATTTLVVASPALALTKRDSLVEDRDQDGIASPGDELAYKLILTNSGNQAAGSVSLRMRRTATRGWSMAVLLQVWASSFTAMTRTTRKSRLS